MRPSSRFLFALLPLAATAGCSVILGIDDFKDAPAGGSGGTTASGGTTSMGGTMTGGGGATGGTMSTGGTMTGGGGATGGTTGSVCEPGHQMDCYDGTPGTEGVGACKGGQQTCNGDGSGYGPCEGQVVDKTTEDCSTPADDNCNNLTNLQEGCCVPNQLTTCYTGPSGTAGVGQCKYGMVTCNSDGTFPALCPNEKVPSDEFCAAAADEDCNGYNCFVWAQKPNGFGNEYGSAVATDGFQNRIFITGAHSGDVLFPNNTVQFPGGGQNNSFVAQYNPDGSLGWAKAFGKKDTAVGPYSIAADSNAGVVVGGYFVFGDLPLGGNNLAWMGSFDGYVLRLNLDGSYRASRRIAGTGHDTVYSTAITTDGVLVAGDTDSANLYLGDPVIDGILVTNGGYDIFLCKYDRVDDHLVWSLDIGGAGNESAVSGQTMSADFVSGRIYLGGNAAAGLQIGALPALPAGTTSFLTAIDSAGVPVWVKSFKNAPGSMFVASSPLGPYVVYATDSGAVDFGGGQMQHVDQYDIYLAHWDPSGNFQWQKTLATMGSENISSIAADATGLVISAIYDTPFTLGSTTLAAPGTPQSGAFVVKYDFNGNVLWVQPMGAALSLALDNNHFTVFTGGFNGSVDFGGGSMDATLSTIDIVTGKLGK